MPTPDPDNTTAILAHSDTALGALVAARVVAGTAGGGATGVEGDWGCPVDALDAALAQDDTYQAARARAADTIGRLRHVVGPEHLDLVLELDAAVGAQVAAVVEASFRLGLLTAGRGRTPR